MKIYVELDGKYILLDKEEEFSNSTDTENTLLINEAMDKLENKRLRMEIARQKEGGYLVKKLDVHPSFGNKKIVRES